MIRPAVSLLVFFTALTGIGYPLAITGIAQLFPTQARGDLTLIAQPFTDPKYVWPRPSAAHYDATASTGSNLGPSNPDLRTQVAARVAALKAADPGNDALVPIDLVTTSASGLDPHESPAAARYQAPRIARARDLPLDAVVQLIDQHTEAPTFGLLGEPRVNVLLLNRALDEIAAKHWPIAPGGPNVAPPACGCAPDIR